MTLRLRSSVVTAPASTEMPQLTDIILGLKFPVLLLQIIAAGLLSESRVPVRSFMRHCFRFVFLLVACIIAVGSPAMASSKKHTSVCSAANQLSAIEHEHPPVAQPILDPKAIRVRMVINASATNVWKAIRDTRSDDPDVKFTKITWINDTQRILEQKYVSVPFLGATTCVLHVSEDPLKRIDYELVRSEHLSEFNGTWLLSEAADGRSTVIEVSNHLKLKFPLPQKIVDAFTRHKLKSRVQMVKESAEAAELQLVHAPECSKIAGSN